MNKDATSASEEKNCGTFKVRINPKIYTLDVVYSTAYVFLDDFYVIIDGDPEKEILVSLKPKNDSKIKKDVIGDFNNQLVSYAFYKKQTEKNSDIRKMIMQRALATSEAPKDTESAEDTSVSSGQVGEFKASDASFIEDPEGIAIPWEKKFKKDSKVKDAGEKNGR